LNLTHLLHDLPPQALRSSTLRRVSERGTLRIGYLSARPWIYRLAQSLKARVWFVECRAGALATFWPAAKSTLRSAGWSTRAWRKCAACLPGT
jgi:hypothetical protein